MDPARPYNDLPPLPPQADLESRAVLRACIEARAALAELKAGGELIPNPSIIINTIPLLEARASSEIENIVTTADRLFRFSQHEEHREADPATKEALRYRTALRRGYESLRRRPVCTATAVEVCRTLRALDIDIRRVPGTALRSLEAGAVIYTPPEGESLIRDLLANWERFLHESTELDPLIRMAAGHYQFEAIHPFTDGNGRTGRILNLLFLVGEGLLDAPVLYLSRAIIHRKAEYYRRLREVTTHAAWEPWLLFMIEAVSSTARWTTGRIRRIQRSMKATADRIREQAPGVYSRELVEVIFTQPYCRIGNVVEAGIAKRQAASSYLKTLCEIGVLKEVPAGRDKLFVHTALIELLTSEDAG